jgi:hypothetical protein
MSIRAKRRGETMGKRVFEFTDYAGRTAAVSFVCSGDLVTIDAGKVMAAIDASEFVDFAKAVLQWEESRIKERAKALIDLLKQEESAWEGGYMPVDRFSNGDYASEAIELLIKNGQIAISKHPSENRGDRPQWITILHGEDEKTNSSDGELALRKQEGSDAVVD